MNYKHIGKMAVTAIVSVLLAISAVTVAKEVVKYDN